MQNLQEAIVVPFRAGQSTLFIRSHSQLVKGIQILLYLTMVKLVCVAILLLLNWNCGFHQIESWSLMYVIAQCFCISHYNSLKRHLAKTEQMLNLSMVLEGQFSEIQQRQPSQKDIKEMNIKLGLSLWQLNPDIYKKYRFIILNRQILIFYFIIMLGEMPFKVPFLYFYGNCNDFILNAAYICFISVLIESRRFYQILIKQLIRLPQFLFKVSRILCAILYQKIKQYILLKRIRNQIYQFNTYQYQGELGQECSVCMADYKVGDTVMGLPCNGNHIFHQTCIKEWLQISIECPLCRQPLVDPSLNLTHI